MATGSSLSSYNLIRSGPTRIAERQANGMKKNGSSMAGPAQYRTNNPTDSIPIVWNSLERICFIGAFDILSAPGSEPYTLSGIPYFFELYSVSRILEASLTIRTATLSLASAWVLAAADKPVSFSKDIQPVLET